MKVVKIQDGVLGQKKYDISEYFEVGEIVSGIVTAICDALKCDEDALEPLYDSVDTDGLQFLLRPKEHGVHQPDLTIMFDYAQHTISVRGDGILSIGHKRSRWIGTPRSEGGVKSGSEDGRDSAGDRKEQA